MRSLVIAIATLSAVNLLASQPLETETARMMGAGVAKVEGTVELQTSNAGRERAWPLLLEYGLTDRTEITVEPVFGTTITPKSGPSARGAGDLEVTVTHLLIPESSGPAIAVAGEIKFPTARNPLIGTGKTDYTGYVIGSKRFDRLDVHANLGYTVIGRPAGTRLKNIIDYALAEEFHLSPRLDIVAEFVGNTSSTGESVEGPVPVGTTTAPEATGAENSIMVGVRHYLRPSLFLSLGVSYDNNHALLVRPGITYRFPTR